jgi:hypothetical protein
MKARNLSMNQEQIRRAVARELEKLEPLIKAIGYVKTAGHMADNLPDRDSDQDGHDAQIRALHSTVKGARAAVEDHLGSNVGRAARLRVIRGGGSGTPGSGTDDNLPYEPSGGDGLSRAKAAIDDAEDEADRLVDRIAGGDEAAVHGSANNLHFHTKTADGALQDYRDALANPESKARRESARAHAAVVMAGFGQAPY